jgi:hypothetical protein
MQGRLDPVHGHHFEQKAAAPGQKPNYYEKNKVHNCNARLLCGGQDTECYPAKSE